MKYLLLMALFAFTHTVTAEQACHYPSKSDGGHLGADDCGVVAADRITLKEKYFSDLRFNDDDLACIYTRGKGVYYINRNKKSIRALAYDNGCDYFEEGLARAEVSGKKVFIDPSLNVLIEPGFEYISAFHYSHAVVCNGLVKDDSDDEHTALTGGKCGLIDKKGKLVVDAIHTIEDREIFQDYINNNNHCSPPPITTKNSALCHAKRHVGHMHAMHNGSAEWQNTRISQVGDVWIITFLEKFGDNKTRPSTLLLDGNKAHWKSLLREPHEQALQKLQKSNTP